MRKNLILIVLGIAATIAIINSETSREPIYQKPPIQKVNEKPKIQQTETEKKATDLLKKINEIYKPIYITEAKEDPAKTYAHLLFEEP